MMLVGWKSICRYLQCSRQTARRWTAEYELPVRRTKWGRVYASQAHLDKWLETVAATCEK